MLPHRNYFLLWGECFYEHIYMLYHAEFSFLNLKVWVCVVVSLRLFTFTPDSVFLSYKCIPQIMFDFQNKLNTLLEDYSSLHHLNNYKIRKCRPSLLMGAMALAPIIVKSQELYMAPEYSGPGPQPLRIWRSYTSRLYLPESHSWLLCCFQKTGSGNVYCNATYSDLDVWKAFLLPLFHIPVTTIPYYCYRYSIFLLPLFRIPVTAIPYSCYHYSVLLLPLFRIPVTTIPYSCYHYSVFLVLLFRIPVSTILYSCIPCSCYCYSILLLLLFCIPCLCLPLSNATGII